MAKQSSIRVHTNTLTGDFFHTSVVMAIVNKVMSFRRVAHSLGAWKLSGHGHGGFVGLGREFPAIRAQGRAITWS